MSQPQKSPSHKNLINVFRKLHSFLRIGQLHFDRLCRIMTACAKKHIIIGKKVA